MALRKVTGHVSHQNPNGEAKVLVAGLVIKEKQMKLVAEMLGWAKTRAKGEGITEEHAKRLNDGILERNELKLAHHDLRGALASPYFIAKNIEAKAKKFPGCYDLTRFKQEAAKKAIAKAEDVPAGNKPKAKGKKEAAPKKEAKAKKETKQITAGDHKPTPDAAEVLS